MIDNIDMDDDGKVKYHFVIIDYHVKVKSAAFKVASDAEDLKWVPFNEVETYDLTSSFRVFFRRNRQKLEQI